MQTHLRSQNRFRYINLVITLFIIPLLEDKEKLNDALIIYIYYNFGNITPNDQIVKSGTALKKAMEQSAECEEKLTALLEDKEKAMLLRLINAENEIGSTMALENFILGFRLGVRMILEALDEDDGSLLDPNKEG